MIPLAPQLVRRFVVLRALGRGAAGHVYLVEDHAAGPPVRALKVARRRRGVSKARLVRREFEILRGLSHPGLVRVFDFGEDADAGLVWMTSEFIAGPDILAASADWGPDELRGALIALGESILFLHERQVVHNDLKASNVRVPAGPRSATLLDFGLASAVHEYGTTGGTPAYVAPERLRGRTARPSAAADLYALGALMYHCATRRPPFEGDTPAGVLAGARDGLVPPAVLRPELSASLDEILVRLLAADSRGRYPSAAELLEDLGHCGLATRAPGGLPGAPLVGRDDVVAEIRREIEAPARSGVARALLIGEAGIGKSRILDELRHRLELDGWAVVAARAQPGAGGAWRLLGEMARQLETLPGAPGLPAGLAALAAPVTSGGGSGATGEAFAGYVHACAQAAPLALIVDDLAWGDPSSVSALVELGLDRRGGERLAVLAATREEPASSGLVGRWTAEGLPLIRLGPLPDGAQHEILASHFPNSRLPARLLADGAAMAAGNPLALEEIARAWVEAGTLTRSNGVWKAVGGPPNLPSPAARAPRDLIASRLRGLDAGARRALRIVALHGGPLSRPVLAHLVPDLDAHVSALRETRFLVETSAGVDVRHPLVRDAALSGGSDAETRSLSLALGQALESAASPSEDLWSHFLRGGDLRRGARHGLLAGLRAESAEDHATGRAILEEVFRASERRAGLLSAAEARRLWESLAVCLDETGDRPRAIGLLERVLEGAPAADLARLELRLGRVLHHAGNFERAERCLRRADEGAQDPRVAVEASAALGSLLAFVGRFADAQDVCARRLAMVRDLERAGHEGPWLVRFFLVAAWAEQVMCGTGSALPLVEAGVRSAERTGLRGLTATARAWGASVMVDAGRLDDAFAELAAAEQKVPAVASGIVRLSVDMAQAHALRERGDAAAALLHIARVLEACLSG